MTPRPGRPRAAGAKGSASAATAVQEPARPDADYEPERGRQIELRATGKLLLERETL